MSPEDPDRLLARATEALALCETEMVELLDHLATQDAAFREELTDIAKALRTLAKHKGPVDREQLMKLVTRLFLTLRHTT